MQLLAAHALGHRSPQFVSVACLTSIHVEYRAAEKRLSSQMICQVKISTSFSKLPTV